MADSGEDIWSSWLRGQRFRGGEREDRTRSQLVGFRDAVLDHAAIEEGDTVLDIGAGDGLIGFGALERVGESGTVVFSDISDPLLDGARASATDAGVADQCEFVAAPAQALEPIGTDAVDVVTFRSVLVYIEDKHAVFDECKRVLKPGGRLSLFEPIHDFISELEPLDSFLGYDLDRIDHDVHADVRELSGKLETFARDHGADHSTSMDFDERDLFAFAERAGFRDVNLSFKAWNTVRWETERWDAWLDSSPAPGVPTKRAAIEGALTPTERERFVAHARPLVEGRTPIDTSGAAAYLWATNPS